MGEDRTFDTIFQGSPFLVGLVRDKIAKEIAARDVTITQLTSDTETLKTANFDLKVRLVASEKLSTEASSTQEQLIDLLVETGVI